MRNQRPNPYWSGESLEEADAMIDRTFGAGAIARRGYERTAEEKEAILKWDEQKLNMAARSMMQQAQLIEADEWQIMIQAWRRRVEGWNRQDRRIVAKGLRMSSADVPVLADQVVQKLYRLGARDDLKPIVQRFLDAGA